MTNNNIIYYFFSLISGTLGAWAIAKYGSKIGVLDVPNHRSSHSKILPKGGGLGILTSFVVVSLFLGVSKVFLVSAFILSLVSFLGDRFDISPKLRLVVQFVCSIVFLIGFFSLNKIDSSFYFLILIGSIFIVGTLNFYNFMDGIDGISGIMGVVSFFLLWLYGHISGADSVYVTLCLVITFACIGFLPFNILNAKVFMGDVGSVLLGFVFACIVISLSKDLIGFVTMIGFLFMFYADTFSTMAIRIKDKELLIHPHRRHLYQLLVNEYNISHWKIASIYGIIQLLIGLSLIVSKDFGISVLTSMVIAYSFCFVFVTSWVRLRLKCS